MWRLVSKGGESQRGQATFAAWATVVGERALDVVFEGHW